MDEELNTRLRTLLRELREVSFKLEVQLAVTEPIKTADEWVCDCSHSRSMHGNEHGCYVLVEENAFCPCTVLNS